MNGRMVDIIAPPFTGFLAPVRTLYTPSNMNLTPTNRQSCWDQGPSAGEYLLHALAACVTTAIVYHAAARGIAIEEIESSIDGDVDLRGFLGIDPKVRNGFEEIRMNFRIKADVPDDQLQELCMIGQQYSPVLDSISRGVPVKVAAERMA